MSSGGDLDSATASPAAHHPGPPVMAGFSRDFFNAGGVSRDSDALIQRSAEAFLDFLGAEIALFALEGLDGPETFILRYPRSQAEQNRLLLAAHREIRAFFDWLPETSHGTINSYTKKFSEDEFILTLCCSPSDSPSIVSGSPGRGVLFVIADKKRSRGLGAPLPVTERYDENHCPWLFEPFMFLATALRRREANLSFFPPELRRGFWLNALGLEGGIELPWAKVPNGEVIGHRTITLSLDLRRSTFAMREAKNKKLHADWLEALVEILRKIAHDNLGIFDKFTGDGVIAHFLVDAIGTMDRGQGSVGTLGSDAIFSRERQEARAKLRSTGLLALKAAREMITAVNRHLEHSMPNMRFLSSQFGAAVGLAEDDAVWSMDRDGRPIVVGTGVVGACRLSGGASGQIRLPNDLKMALDGSIPRSEFHRLFLDSHKDYPDALGLYAWAIESGAEQTGTRVHEIYGIVDAYWAQIVASDAYLGTR
jgi:hypothetical protein